MAVSGCVLEDPLQTDLRHFHPSAPRFEALRKREFTLVRRIGSCINGDVFRFRWERQADGDRDVCVKRMGLEVVARSMSEEHNERKVHMGSGASCPEDALNEIGVFRYLREQRDLPVHLLRMFEVFQDRFDVWLVMEHADGGDLFNQVKLHGPLSAAKTRRYTWETLQAVSYLHEHRIAHRDISTENILLKGGVVRLMDFGAAVLSSTDHGVGLRYFRAVGKESCRAPECHVPRSDFVDVLVPPGAAPGSVVTARMTRPEGVLWCDVLLPPDAVPQSRCRALVYGYLACPADVFAVGICLTIMLTGSVPWKCARFKYTAFAWAFEHDVVALLSVWGQPELMPDLADLLRGMLAMQPSGRWSARGGLSSAWLAEHASDEVPAHAAQAADAS